MSAMEADSLLSLVLLEKCEPQLAARGEAGDSVRQLRERHLRRHGDAGGMQLFRHLGAHQRGADQDLTLAIDDELISEAQALTGLQAKSALIREALKALIEREAARRLVRLGGSEPDAFVVPRRRFVPE